MAFVIVQHLDPNHVSNLARLLGKITEMPVIELTGPTAPRPNTVYVQPPNKCVIFKNGLLTLVRRQERLNLAIDHFFESLAEESRSRAIGVILSGTGSDGTAGVRAIKAAGGLTFAQDQESAKFSDMPRSAINSGFVDLTLPPREIAREIGRIAAHPYVQAEQRPDGDDGAALVEQPRLDDLGRIYLSLKKQTGVDFTAYKQTTLNRRIQRRMALHKIERLTDYARFVYVNEREVAALFNDLLINVTSFFRDQRLFTSLQNRFLPALFKRRNEADLRMWVPGCATGEEVYSFAICLIEALGRRARNVRIQIFGTDLSEPVIDFARAGIYSSAIEKDVSPARLKRFFQKRDSSYQINREVRDLCTFARQNMISDPPFSRLDLISCRNVLIYLNPEAHKRCLPEFHFALKPGGYLILGPTETVGRFNDLFDLVDKRNRIYIKKPLPSRLAFDPVEYRRYETPRAPARLSRVDTALSIGGEVMQMADRIILSNYAPGAAVIDSEMHVHQFRGRTGRYIEHAAGPATLNILQLVHRSLGPDLRMAIYRAKQTGKPARKERAMLKLKDQETEVNIEVVPFNVASADNAYLLVIFDETTKGTKARKKTPAPGKTAAQKEIVQLQRELDGTKESLQAIIEEQEATNEELKSANEEIESSNEELQSTNEELETAKEELQSTNEELTTLNEELSNRNLEMMQVNNDLNNLFSSIHLPIVTVNDELLVQRATPLAREAFNIMQTDIGRPIRHLKPNVDIPDLEKILRQVIDTLATHESEVDGPDGGRYILRIRPYRTLENKIEGAVIALMDIDGRGHDGETSTSAKKVTQRRE
jgi:two-component system CheB/CheR fusion protein